MRARLLWLGLVVGCSFHPGATGDDVHPGDDARIDTIPIDGCSSFSQQLDTCVQPVGDDLTLSGKNGFDTDTGILTTAAGPITVATAPVTLTTNAVEVQAIFVHDLTLSSSAILRGIGTRPLAIVATGTVTLGDGSLVDVGYGGAGARTMCGNGAEPGVDNANGASGGGGGGFGAPGGKGGNGNSDGSQSTGGAGGMAIIVPPGPLGGCPGAHGGTGSDLGGEGGAAGGAIYIVAAVAIDVKASAGVNAGGGGGSGGMRTSNHNGDAGGGGGGAGGMIFLEGPQVHSLGILSANGGGGGEASGNGDPGNFGANATLGVARANGGALSSPTGTDGGKGGNATTPAGDTPTNVQPGGGGGGGGGVGFIRIVSPDAAVGALVSPVPS
jgi:hypothetical protein